MNAIGIDLGLDGALCCLDTAGKIVALDPMPTSKDSRGKRAVDAVGVNRWFGDLLDGDEPQVGLVVMEFVHSFGNEARSAMFSFGRGTGKVQAVLELRGIAYEEVPPQTWKKAILEGTKKDKDAAIGYCTKRWPKADLRWGNTERYSDGKADALCIAEFARRRVLGGS